MRKSLILLCILMSIRIYAQDAKRIYIEFAAGSEFGQWKVNRGAYASGITSVDIVDRSRISFSLPFKISALYSLNKFLLGLEVKNNVLYTNSVKDFGSSYQTTISNTETINL